MCCVCYTSYDYGSWDYGSYGSWDYGSYGSWDYGSYGGYCYDDDAVAIATAAATGTTISGCADLATVCDDAVYGAIIQPICPATCGGIDYGATDSTGDGCESYVESWCGGYDDDDFSSNSMCCVCQGSYSYGSWDYGSYGS